VDQVIGAFVRGRQRDEAIGVCVDDAEDGRGAAVHAENVVAADAAQVLEGVRAAPVHELLFMAVAALPQAVAGGVVQE
tara:strand:+ start:7245 stop:7478 length:234 start_codon:yes stop_codon:yes gene_type:complete